MPIDNPTSLVEEFKKSGEFDRLRREVLMRFQQDGSYSALKTRVEEIGRQRLTTDQTLQYLSQETVQKELAQEVERYPIIERAVADVRIFSDPTFLANMQGSIQKILHDEPRGQSSMPKDNETAVREITTKSMKNAADAQPTAESARLSSSDTMLDKVSTSQRPSEEDKTEPAESIYQIKAL
ncbi:hypothetical protein BJ912DRAFT_924900 [Pholiota molesta]|nr:hypothetical protein BJ912DRAFT_924900 [Pholiota molesta]